MSERVVFAIYRPKEGKDEEFRELLQRHVATLREEGLVTEREPLIVSTSRQREYIEIFGWATEDAARQAHENPRVAALWEAMMEIADFPSLGDLAEAQGRFPHFDPVDLSS